MFHSSGRTVQLHDVPSASMEQPAVLKVRCDWFLRYLEPYALLALEDPIYTGCRPSFQESGYSDWEECLQDGRIAWTESQWILANLEGPFVGSFQHREIDQ